MSLSTKLKTLIHSALGSPEARDELVSSLENNINSVKVAAKFNSLLDKLDASTDLAENDFKSTLGIVDGAENIDNITAKFDALLDKLDASTDLSENDFRSLLGL